MIRPQAVAALLLSFAVSAAAGEFQPQRSVGLLVIGGKSITNWHGQATVTSVAFEFGRTISPRLEVASVFASTVIDQPKSWFGDDYGDGNETVRAGALALVGRYHFRPEAVRFAPYVEIGTGPMWADKRVPAATSRFNFISHVGTGVVLFPQSRAPIVLGHRFSHISNGGYAPRNPGWNVNSLVVGTTLRSPWKQR